jgi:putative transposase
MSKRLTESQIVAILKEAEAGIPVPELCRRHGIGQSNFYIYGLPPYCKR